MSLVRLLAAGRSLVGLKDRVGHYRLTDQRLLPNFGSANNPFRTNTKPAEDDKPGAITNAQPGLTDGSGGGTVDKAESGAERQDASPATGVSEPKRDSQVPRSAPPRKSSSRISTKLWYWRENLRFRFGRVVHRKLPRSPFPGIPKVPVQGELSLDRVRVVRNDLTDVDLEVVPAKPSQPGMAAERGLVPDGAGRAGVAGVEGAGKGSLVGRSRQVGVNLARRLGVLRD